MEVGSSLPCPNSDPVVETAAAAAGVDTFVAVAVAFVGADIVAVAAVEGQDTADVAMVEVVVAVGTAVEEEEVAESVAAVGSYPRQANLRCCRRRRRSEKDSAH